MYRNRFALEVETIRLPQPPAPRVTTQGFMICPATTIPVQSMEQWTCLQWLYQRAFEMAQAVARPSLLERDLLAYWN